MRILTILVFLNSQLHPVKLSSAQNIYNWEKGIFIKCNNMAKLTKLIHQPIQIYMKFPRQFLVCVFSFLRIPDMSEIQDKYTCQEILLKCLCNRKYYATHKPNTICIQVLIFFRLQLINSNASYMQINCQCLSSQNYSCGFFPTCFCNKQRWISRQGQWMPLCSENLLLAHSGRSLQSCWTHITLVLTRSRHKSHDKPEDSLLAEICNGT